MSVWPTENWLSSSLNQIPGWTTVLESYPRALEQGPLAETFKTVGLVKGGGDGGNKERKSAGEKLFFLSSSPASLVWQERKSSVDIGYFDISTVNV